MDIETLLHRTDSSDVLEFVFGSEAAATELPRRSGHR